RHYCSCPSPFASPTRRPSPLTLSPYTTLFRSETPRTSFHAHNEHAKARHLVERMQAGATVALVSDAGTPGISDPGFLLVREALRSEEHTSELQSRENLVCRLLLVKKKQ